MNIKTFIFGENCVYESTWTSFFSSHCYLKISPNIRLRENVLKQVESYVRGGIIPNHTETKQRQNMLTMCVCVCKLGMPYISYRPFCNREYYSFLVYSGTQLAMMDF